MQHTQLGRTGLQVSRLCLGTMTFGLQIDEEASRAILDHGFENGITFIDSSDMYPLAGGPTRVGVTEAIIGRWMAGRRDRVVLGTKVGITGPSPWDRGNSRRHLLDAVEGSLRRFGTEYLDLYEISGPDPNTPIDETLQALDDLITSGKVRYIGASNVKAYQLARMLGRSEVLGTARYDVVQPRYNLLFREPERELFPLAGEEGVGVIAYNPLAGGLLTGKHDVASPPAENTRFGFGGGASSYRDRYWHDREFETVAAVGTFAKDLGVSIVTLAVAWVLANPVITAPIVGASRPDQLDDVIAAVDSVIPAEMKTALDELTHEYRFGDAAR